jgi:hypothetical protein
MVKTMQAVTIFYCKKILAQLYEDNLFLIPPDEQFSCNEKNFHSIPTMFSHLENFERETFCLRP